MQVFFKTVLIQLVNEPDSKFCQQPDNAAKDSRTLLQKERGAVLQFSSFNTEIKGPFLCKKKVAISQ